MILFLLLLFSIPLLESTEIDTEDEPFFMTFEEFVDENFVFSPELYFLSIVSHLDRYEYCEEEHLTFVKVTFKEALQYDFTLDDLTVPIPSHWFNRTTGFPYPETTVTPDRQVPAHVIPVGCGWYSEQSGTGLSCEASQCPEGYDEIFRGTTRQRTYVDTKNSEVRACPRQVNTYVSATFCCDHRVFTENTTIGKFDPIFPRYHQYLKEDCYWIGRHDELCNDDTYHNSGCKFGTEHIHEIARAQEAWIYGKHKENAEVIKDLSYFGPSKCDVFTRALCCRDSAFLLPKLFEDIAKTAMNFMFVTILPEKDPVKLTTASTHTPTTTKPGRVMGPKVSSGKIAELAVKAAFEVIEEEEDSTGE